MDLLSLPFLLMVITATATGDPPSPQVPPLPPGPPPPVLTHGSLGRATVRDYIRLHLPAIRFCYVQELGRQPTLTRKVAVSFDIDPTGYVTSCTSSGDSSLERCVVQAVNQLRFPAVYNVLSNGQQVLSSAATAVTYRFSFRPARPRQPGEPPRTLPARHDARVAAPQRSGPPLPGALNRPPPGPHVAPPRPTASPASPDQKGPPATRPTTRPASGPAEAPAGGGTPRKPRIEAPGSDDPLDGLDLSDG